MHQHDDFRILHEFYKAARHKLEPGPWDYLRGAAETETTFRRNRAAIDDIAFRPRVLRDVEHVDTGTRLLGHPLRIPVVLAPIGSLQDFDPEGGAAAARACGDAVRHAAQDTPRSRQGAKRSVLNASSGSSRRSGCRAPPE